MCLQRPALFRPGQSDERDWTRGAQKAHRRLAPSVARPPGFPVAETVAKPDHVEPDALPARTRFYRRSVGPSRWLMAVVSYEQEPARIITARQVLNRDGRLIVTVPETVEASADDRAPALEAA